MLKYNRTRDTIANQKTGYAVHVHLADQSDITAFGGPDVAPASQKIITGDHTFDVGNGFVKAYVLPDKTQLDGASHGSPGANTMSYKVGVFFPGDDMNSQEMFEDMLNKSLLLLVEDANSPGGPIWQLGSEKLPANVVASSFLSGTVYNGEKGWSLEIQASERFEYQGTITQQV